MLFQKTLIALFIVFSFTKINAQKFELGKVSVKELQEINCPFDTTAVAAILYNKAKTVFIYKKEGFYINHEYEFRIKIYKTEGLSWANYKIPYYIGYENINPDAVTFTDAVTYNLENNAIVKTKLKNEGSFNTKINNYWREAGITMPNVKVGSVIEFKYIIKSENISKFPIFNFQYPIPVKYSQYVSEVPEFFVYNPILSGFCKIKSEASVGFGYQNYDDKNNQGIRMSYKQINSSYSAENIPALKEENYVDNLQNYRSSLDYELERTRFPEVPEKNYATTWEDVATVIYKEKEFGKELNEHAYFDPTLRLLLKDAVTETDKVNVIFKFVQNKMNWNGNNSYYTDKGVVKAYEDGSGNAAEINFILISMLNAAGLNANPVLISTKDHGVPLYPNRSLFNHVIAAVEMDGNQILLDATNKFVTINILPFNDLNWTGRLIRQDGTSKEINLVPETQSKEIINLMATIGTSGRISGKTRLQKTDYNALKIREKYAVLSTENYIEKLENELNDLQINNYQVENKDTDLTKPIIETFSFESDNSCEIIGEKMFLNPMLFYTLFRNPFVQEKRELPIYYGYPKQLKFNGTIEIPEGYAIESIPTSITVATSDKSCVFSLKNSVSEDKVQMVITIDINSALFSADYYPELKEFYQKMIDKLNEKIILKKR